MHSLENDSPPSLYNSPCNKFLQDLSCPNRFLIFFAQPEHLSKVEWSCGKMKFMIEGGDLEPVS